MLILTKVSICLCSVIRFTTLPPLKDTHNTTWAFTEPIYWIAIEVYVSIIVPSFPAVRSLLSHHLPGWFANDAPIRAIHLDQVAPHPYFRARSGKGIKGSAETGPTLFSTRWSRESSNVDSYGQNDAWERGEQLGLEDRNRGMVLTEVVAGKRDKNSNGNHNFYWNNQGSGIVVSTTTETVFRAKEQDWMDDVELGNGSQGTSGWNRFDRGKR